MAAQVIVAGGGLAGSVAAIALHRCGIATTVFEAYDDPAGTVGSFLSLTANGLRALRALDCLDQVLAGGFTVADLCVWNSAGRLLGTVARGGRSADRLTSLTITRGGLVAALRAEAVAAGARVHTGKWLADAAPVPDGIVARFTDGTRAAGDLLIGADGIHSRTRRLIDPAAPTPEPGGGCAVDGVADAPAIAPGALHVVLGRRATFLYTASPTGAVWWSALVPADGPAPAELAALSDRERRNRVVQLYADDRTPAAGLVQSSATVGRPVPSHARCRVARWCRGRMVVIGDAAHPVDHSVGASLAIEDAVVLARCVRDLDDVPAALAAYEALRRPRVERASRPGMAHRTCARRWPGRYGMDTALAALFLRYFWAESTAWLLTYDVWWQRRVRVPDT